MEREKQNGRKREFNKINKRRQEAIRRELKGRWFEN
jgi:hypothetical protein